VHNFLKRGWAIYIVSDYLFPWKQVGKYNEKELARNYMVGINCVKARVDPGDEQGCQTFLDTIHIPKRGKIYQITTTLPNGHKIYQMTVKYSK
jgi:hypothetical protein